MPININVKTKIRFNGHEYDGIESMPPEVRASFEKVMASAGKSGSPVVFHTSKKIVFNGQEYAGVDQMPGEIRKLYEDVMATVDAEMVARAGTAVATKDEIPASALAPSAARPESTSSRLVIVALVIAAFILVSFVWGR